MHTTMVRTIGLMMVLALTFGPFTSAQAESNKSASVLTFVAEADSQIQEANPDSNAGDSEAILHVEGGDDHDIESYLQFKVTDI